MSQNIEPLKVDNYSISLKWSSGKKEKLREQDIAYLDNAIAEVIETFITDYEYIVNEEIYNKHKGE